MAEIKSSIVAVLNCYQPASGRNVSQVTLRECGEVEIHGDDGIGRRVIGRFVNARLPASAPAEPVRSAGRAPTAEVSEFDDVMAEALEEALDVFGRVTARIRQTNVEGTLNALSTAEQYAMGGMVPNVKQTFVFPLAALPTAKTLRAGEAVKVAGKTFKIGHPEVDEISVTLYLISPDAG